MQFRLNQPNVEYWNIETTQLETDFKRQGGMLGIKSGGGGAL
jgi:hypothetical protein